MQRADPPPLMVTAAPYPSVGNGVCPTAAAPPHTPRTHSMSCRSCPRSPPAPAFGSNACSVRVWLSPRPGLSIALWPWFDVMLSVLPALRPFPHFLVYRFLLQLFKCPSGASAHQTTRPIATAIRRPPFQRIPWPPHLIRFGSQRTRCLRTWWEQFSCRGRRVAGRCCVVCFPAGVLPARSVGVVSSSCCRGFARSVS